MAAFMQGTAAQADDALRELSALVSHGEGGLMTLVTALGSALTDPDERKRERGTRCLAEVLHRIPPEFLVAGALSHLLTFFSERLTDYPTLGAVLRGLLALVHAPLLPGQSFDLTLALAERCDIRSLVQVQRHAALELSLLLVDRHWDALKPSGCRVLMSLLRAIDGEKDPRNLLLFLQLLKELCTRCAQEELGGFEETLPEVFEAVSCYFPITFTPPPNDPHQITSNHLLQALLRMLRGCSSFARLALPFFVAKLREAEEDEAATKLQAMQSLSILGAAYGSAHLAPFAEKIGSALSDQLGGGLSPMDSNDVVIASVAQAFRPLLQLPLPPAVTESLLAPLISRACTARPAGPGAGAAGVLLRAAAHASDVAAEKVAVQALPALARRISSIGATPAERLDALALLLSLLQTLSSAPDAPQKPPNGIAESVESSFARPCPLANSIVCRAVSDHRLVLLKAVLESAQPAVNDTGKGPENTNLEGGAIRGPAGQAL